MKKLLNSISFAGIFVLLAALQQLTEAQPQQQEPFSGASNVQNQPPPPPTTTTTSTVGEHQDASRRQENGQQPLAEDEYFVGVGIADITGPSADINLMGYAKPSQDAGGIHLRQFCRSLVIEDSNGGRLLYVNLDNGMISQLLRINVLNELKQLFGPNTFNETNVMLTATHTHSCPGGFFQYMLYNIPSAGFIKETLDALTSGIVRSVQRAYASLEPARIFMNKGELLDASINRSPTAYLNNPKEELANYKHNTDKEMSLLRIVDRRNQPLAMVNWFAVHGTSMNSSNHLISSDNKGYAALLFEQDYNPVGTLPGKGKFVAIFAQANEGDVSPNTRGPRCIDTGLPCDAVTSTCGNPPRNEKCIASGPGRDMFESTQMIAYKQYYKAKQLFSDNTNQKQVRGPIRVVHQHIDITEQMVPAYESAQLVKARRNQKKGAARRSLADADTLQRPIVKRTEQTGGNTSAPIAETYKTCRASLGYSFAAGTTDGPGALDFQQSGTVSSRYWDLVRDFLKRPSDELVKCHHPKPILLATGQMDFPYMWHPRVVPTQLFMVGQLAIVGLPGEFTTMAGRRVREAVRRVLSSGRQRFFEETSGQFGKRADEGASKLARNRSGGPTPAADPSGQLNEIEVVLSGLSNIYTSYVTTIEEYEMQRYEGASTLYGPHTLQAYSNQFEKLARDLLAGRQPSDTLRPPDLSRNLFTLKAGVIFDGAPHGKQFGSLLEDVDPNRVYANGERVSVSFVAGNPRNDPLQEESFLHVELFNHTAPTSWTVVATDANWETKFIWQRTNTLFGESRATIEWDIPSWCSSGIYRVRHFGAHKSLMQQTVAHYSGRSSPFKVVCGQASGSDPQPDLHRLEEMRLFVEQFELANQPEPSGPAVGSTSGQRAEKKSGGRGFGDSLARSALGAPLRFLGKLFHLGY